MMAKASARLVFSVLPSPTVGFSFTTAQVMPMQTMNSTTMATATYVKPVTEIFSTSPFSWGCVTLWAPAISLK